MANRNGYFKIQVETEGVYLLAYPPMPQGEPIDINEVIAYLGMIHVSNYDITLINRNIVNIKEPCKIKLTDEKIVPPNEMSVVTISKDGMNAIIRFYPASNNGYSFSKKDIMGELTRYGVKYGIAERVIDAYLNNKQYCLNIPIAKGKAVREGKDAEIEYHFNISPLSKPKLNEDGTVDFHKLDIFERVSKGQVLATLHLEDCGDEGIDVLENRVLPRKVKKLTLKYGKNISLSEDKVHLISEVDGDVKLEGDTVFVSNTYTVTADVDASTGDIEYDGNIMVTGNVRTGFTIRAKGDIEVRGVVEGANLYAGGSIVLKLGIQGMNRGVLEAQGDIITKFIESATVKAGGKIQSGSILHSTVDTGDMVICEGRKSFIIGGTITAKNSIILKTTGNKMGTITNLKVGADPGLANRIKEIQKELATDSEQLEKYEQVLAIFRKKLASGIKPTADKMPLIKSASDGKKEIERRMLANNEELLQSKERIAENTSSFIKASDIVFPGVRISIATHNYYVKDEQQHCIFHLDRAEIVISGY